MEQLTVFLEPELCLENRNSYFGYKNAAGKEDSSLNEAAFRRALAKNGEITYGEWLLREKARIEKDPSRHCEIRAIDAKSPRRGKQALFVSLDGLKLL